MFPHNEIEHFQSPLEVQTCHFYEFLIALLCHCSSVNSLLFFFLNIIVPEYTWYARYLMMLDKFSPFQLKIPFQLHKGIYLSFSTVNLIAGS